MDKAEKKLTVKQQKKIYLICVVIVAVIMLILTLLITKPLLASLQDSSLFREWLDSFGIFSRLIFMLIVMLQVIIAFVPGEPVELAAGYCFGAVEGTLLCLIAITLACALIFLLVNRVSKDFASIFFSKEDLGKLSFIRDSSKTKLYLLLLNLIPGIPKDILGYFSGLTDIDLKSWILIVFFGRIPSVLSSTLIGSGVAQKSYSLAIIITCITLIISVAGILIYRNILAKNNKEKRNEN